MFKNKFIKNDFFEYDYYEDIIIKFNELDYDIKESLSEFLNFDEKYNRSMYLEIFNLITCQYNKTLKKHIISYIELPKKLQRQGLINIKNDDNYCFIWSYIRYLNPQEKIQIELN